MSDIPQESSWLFQYIISCLVGLLSFFGYNIHEDNKQLRKELVLQGKELDLYKTYVSDNYVKQPVMVRLEDKVDEMQNDIKEILQRVK